MHNSADQCFGFLFMWAKMIKSAQFTGKSSRQIQLAFHSRLEIYAYFSQIPESFEGILAIYGIRLYAEMLAAKLEDPHTPNLNSVQFLAACHSLCRFITKE